MRDTLINHAEGRLGLKMRNKACLMCKWANGGMDINVIKLNKRAAAIARQLKNILETGRIEKPAGTTYVRYDRGRLTKR